MAMAATHRDAPPATPWSPPSTASTTVARHAQRLRAMRRPEPADLDAVRQQLRRCRQDPALRAQVLAHQA